MDKMNHKKFSLKYYYAFACFYCIYEWTVEQDSKKGWKGVDGRIILTL